MALLNQFGYRFPCTTEGIEFDPTDEEIEMYDGDVCEAWWDTDRDINYINVKDALEGILKMKEDYPDFALHWIRFETRKITVQFSCAPYQGSNPISAEGISGQIALAFIWKIAIVVAIIAGIIVATTAAIVQMTRGWVWHRPLPMGRASVTARDRITNLPLPGVEITVSGQSETTGPNGEAAYFEELLEGSHTFIGAIVAGYDPPPAVSAYVTKDKTIDVFIPYNPEGVVPPTEGWLNIDTDPVKGLVYLDGIEMGVAPQAHYVSIGEHFVAFGEVEGYFTPEAQTVTVLGDPYSTPCIGYYTKPEGVWWEKYLMYVLLGTGIIAGSAILVPRLIDAARRPREPKQLGPGKG
jgi:hypothetical protein